MQRPIRNLAHERILAERIGRMPCAWCGRPLGNTPRRISKDASGVSRHYHPACAPERRG